MDSVDLFDWILVYVVGGILMIYLVFGVVDWVVFIGSLVDVVSGVVEVFVHIFGLFFMLGCWC